MHRGRTILAMAIAMTIAVAGVTLAGGTNDEASAGGNPSGNATTQGNPCSFQTTGRRTKIATAKLIVEYNATDDDIGVHGAFDDQGWKRLCVFDPSGRPVLHVGPRGQLLDLTMAGIFFESREPPASEFSFADLRAAFPEGGYTVRGESFDGTILVGSATFTHDVPAAPEITAPELAEDSKGTRANPVPLNGLAIDWDQVTRTVNGGPVSITGYEVIVTKENRRRSPRVLTPDLRRAPTGERGSSPGAQGVPPAEHRVRAGGPRSRGQREPDDQRWLLQDGVDRDSLAVPQRPRGLAAPRPRAALGSSGSSREPARTRTDRRTLNRLRPWSDPRWCRKIVLGRACCGNGGQHPWLGTPACFLRSGVDRAPVWGG